MDSKLNYPPADSWSLEGPLSVEIHSHPQRGWFRTLERLEASAGLTATILLGMIPVILGAIGTIVLLSDGESVLSLVCGSVTLIAAGLATLVGAICSQAVRACFPEWSDDPVAQIHFKPDEMDRFHPSSSFAIETGLSLTRFPGFVQTLLSVWWLLHFAGGALVVVTFHHFLGGKAPLSMMELLLAAAGHFSFLLGANIYLVLAVSALNPDEVLLTRVWSSRFLVDMALTLLVMLCCL